MKYFILCVPSLVENISQDAEAGKVRDGERARVKEKVKRNKRVSEKRVSTYEEKYSQHTHTQISQFVLIESMALVYIIKAATIICVAIAHLMSMV